MIYTITFNPSLDYIMHLSSFEEGETNRSDAETIYPGGKGINVSIVLSHLGFDTKALGFRAGFTGLEIERRIREEGSTVDFIELSEGVSRINVKIKSKVESEINGQGPDIPQEAQHMLIQKLGNLQDGDVLVLAGSVPDYLPSDTYQTILQHVQHKNVDCVVDATGELLTNSLAYKPFLVKPNISELGELFDVSIQSIEEVERYSRKLQEMGAQNVLISMGGDGAFLLDANGQTHRRQAPKGTLVNSVGAGDSMVAGFIAGYAVTGDFKKTFELAVCCGSATAFLPWLAHKEDVRKLLTNPNEYQDLFRG